MDIRKIVTVREIVTADNFGETCKPVTRVAIMAVVKNPCAGRFVEDLTQLFDLGGELGITLAEEAVKMLTGNPVSYGKAAIVGSNGDFEHGAAMIHPRLGKPIRAAVGGGAALIPSNVKLGPMGTTIDLPLGHKDEAWSFDHFDTMSVMIADAPRPDEIVLVIGLADGGRPLPRSGDAPAL